jgi:predicted RNA-binding protein associated with RNAse of E/G family
MSPATTKGVFSMDRHTAASLDSWLTTEPESELPDKQELLEHALNEGEITTEEFGELANMAVEDILTYLGDV